MGRKLIGLHLLLLCLSTTSSTVQADYRGMAIDPPPGSPTLGDLLDRKRSAPPRLTPKPAAKPHPARSMQTASPLRVSEPTPAKALPRVVPEAALRVEAPTAPTNTKAGQPHHTKVREVTIPSTPPEIAVPAAAPPVLRHTAPSMQGLAPAAARHPRPLTILAVKQREPAADPIMTGTTVASSGESEATKSAPADVAQPLPTAPTTAPAREAAKLSEPAKTPEPGESLAPGKSPEPRRASEPPKISSPAPAVPATTTDSGRFVYVVDQDLRSFLTDFARRVGLRSEIAATVRGQITKVKLPAEPTALLKEIEKRHEIEWIIDGETLKVSSRGELATRILPLGKIGYEELLRELKQVGVDTARYPLQPIGGSNAVILTAPAAPVARIADLIEAIKAGKTTGPEIRIIRSGMTSKVNWD